MADKTTLRIFVTFDHDELDNAYSSVNTAIRYISDHLNDLDGVEAWTYDREDHS
jgi:hypothetical protein